jgi:hypothetical protein
MTTERKLALLEELPESIHNHLWPDYDRLSPEDQHRQRMHVVGHVLGPLLMDCYFFNRLDLIELSEIIREFNRLTNFDVALDKEKGGLVHS